MTHLFKRSVSFLKTNKRRKRSFSFVSSAHPQICVEVNLVLPARQRFTPRSVSCSVLFLRPLSRPARALLLLICEIVPSSNAHYIFYTYLSIYPSTNKVSLVSCLLNDTCNDVNNLQGSRAGGKLTISSNL